MYGDRARAPTPRHDNNNHTRNIGDIGNCRLPFLLTSTGMQHVD